MKLKILAILSCLVTGCVSSQNKTYSSKEYIDQKAKANIYRTEALYLKYKISAINKKNGTAGKSPAQIGVDDLNSLQTEFNNKNYDYIIAYGEYAYWQAASFRSRKVIRYLHAESLRIKGFNRLACQIFDDLNETYKDNVLVVPSTLGQAACHYSLKQWGKSLKLYKKILKKHKLKVSAGKLKQIKKRVSYIERKFK